jgi:hypothetical protein
LFDRPKSTVGCSANGRLRRKRGRGEEEEEEEENNHLLNVQK